MGQRVPRLPGLLRPKATVAQVRARAERAARAAGKKRGGRGLKPVRLEGRTIARSFWGRAWCANLESYAELSNRLSRGRSYVCHGAVIHLEAGPGRIEAAVAGSSLYEVTVDCSALPGPRWSDLKRRLSGKVESMVALLKGELPDPVMAAVSRRGEGLFPSPDELRFSCTCPDARGGWMCKHVAAVLYGFGARLDDEPALLFTLRSLDPAELVEHAAASASGLALLSSPKVGRWRRLDGRKRLSRLFGVEVLE